MADWIDRLFNQHKFARRFLLFWAIIMSTAAVWWSMLHPEQADKISDIILGVLGLIATVTAFYQWSRGKDNADMDNR